MMFANSRFPVRLFFSALALFLFTTFAPSCRADNQTLIRRLIHEFVGVGGYWFTDSSAENALGSPKFAGSTTLYVKPAHRSNLELTGGIELFGASDHWLFGGGNSLDLYGASFKLNPERGHLYRLTPFINGGAFVGHIRSERLGFSDTAFVPSGTIGAEIKVHRYVTVTGRYRLSGTIKGVNTDGYMFSIKFF